jgi:hypothetical protein
MVSRDQTNEHSIDCGFEGRYLSFITVETIFWLVLAVSAIHVLEEYAGGWVKFVNSLRTPIGHTTIGAFYLVNCIFILLCALAALLNASFIIFGLSIAALLFINALIHIGGIVRLKRHNPGVVTAVLLYLPLSIYTYYLYDQAGLLGFTNLILSVLLGAGWIGLAVAYGIVASRMKRNV